MFCDYHRTVCCPHRSLVAFVRIYMSCAATNKKKKISNVLLTGKEVCTNTPQCKCRDNFLVVTISLHCLVNVWSLYSQLALSVMPFTNVLPRICVYVDKQQYMCVGLILQQYLVYCHLPVIDFV